MNHSHNESKVKQARKKSIEINRSESDRTMVSKTIREDRRRIRSLMFGERRNRNDGQFRQGI